MTAEQLINLLKLLPADTKILVRGEDVAWTPAIDIQYSLIDQHARIH